MATERVVERTDGVTSERVVERGSTEYVPVERRGSGMGAVMAAIVLIALVAIVGFFLLNMQRQEAAQTEAISGAASSVAESAEGAATAVGDAAQSAAEAINPSN